MRSISLVPGGTLYGKIPDTRSRGSILVFGGGGIFLYISLIRLQAGAFRGNRCRPTTTSGIRAGKILQLSFTYLPPDVAE